ncbi:hypothetical protein [Paenibacillus abyssi]|uniref:Type IV secretion system protein n=1 Tax=Paenibacillus abyssi TaxID=1340531 RepID=A0A917LFG0_9BACL|nr:hypothetical protein [Paenibacillus abyssi]GGG18105.1 hypothetical protein GCM10010916_38640 [Paenibacillus abyssi]
MRKPRNLALVLLLSMVLMFTVGVSSAFAAGTDASSTQQSGSTFTDSNFQTQMEKSIDEAGFVEKAVMKMVNGLFKLAGLATIPDMVFGNPYKNWGFGEGKLHYNTFYDNEMKQVINPMIAVFSSAYVSFIALAIMIASLKIGITPHSPQARADFWKDIQMYIYSALFMGSFWLFFQIIMNMNTAISSSIADTMAGAGLQANNVSVIAAAGTGELFGLGDIVIFLGEWILTVMLNFIYISRKIVLVFLVLLAPFAAYALLFARTRAFFGTWLKELLGNVFLPCIHGLILYTFASMSSLGAGTFFKLGMLIMFIPASGMISKWLQLGDSSSKLGSALTMSGMGGVAGAMMLGRGAMQMAGRGKGNASGGKAGSSPGDAPSGSDYGNTSLSDAASNKRTGLGKATSFAKTSAAVVGGTVGALAGMVAGPGGAMVGGVVGAKLGSGTVSLGSNMASSVVNTAKSGAALASFAKSDNWGTDLAQRRQLLGNMGESMGSVLGEKGGSVGRAAGNALSMATRRRIQTEQFGGNTPADYAAKFPDADVYWKADSQKSGFYMNRGGQEQLISAIGGGVPDLKNPVYVPYRTPPRGAELKQGPKGSYSMTTPNPNVGAGGGPATITTNNAGMSGSTEGFLRTGEAYTMDNNGQKYSYSGLDASSVNVDSYFSHSAPGMKTGTAAGRVLDSIQGTKSVEETRKNAQYTTKLRNIADEYQNAGSGSGRRKAAP